MLGDEKIQSVICYAVTTEHRKQGVILVNDEIEETAVFTNFCDDRRDFTPTQLTNNVSINTRSDHPFRTGAVNSTSKYFFLDGTIKHGYNRNETVFAS